eukprot:GHVR01163146.1.p1 GENE.GHVR01163146.1~~GHVR01163146.1.p1  ORF type:complete len:805 (+),score=142.47 GHVR01163146.1:354-2768(+)
MATLEEISALLQQNALMMQEQLNNLKGEIHTRIDKMKDGKKENPEDEINTMTQEELRKELLKRRRTDTPVSSNNIPRTPEQSPEILLQMAMLNDNVTKMMSQNERISVARLNVDPHSLVCQVGGDMTLGFLSTLIEPIMAIIESWIEGTEIPTAFRMQIKEQLNKIIKINQITPLVTGRQLDLLRTSLAMVSIPNVTSEMVSTATSKKWADKQEQNKFWEDKKNVEGGPPSTRAKGGNQAWQVPNTTVSYTHTHIAPIIHNAGLIEEPNTYMIPEHFIDECFSAYTNEDLYENTHAHTNVEHTHHTNRPLLLEQAAMPGMQLAGVNSDLVVCSGKLQQVENEILYNNNFFDKKLFNIFLSIIEFINIFNNKLNKDKCQYELVNMLDPCTTIDITNIHYRYQLNNINITPITQHTNDADLSRSVSSLVGRQATLYYKFKMYTDKYGEDKILQEIMEYVNLKDLISTANEAPTLIEAYLQADYYYSRLINIYLGGGDINTEILGNEGDIVELVFVSDLAARIEWVKWIIFVTCKNKIPYIKLLDCYELYKAMYNEVLKMNRIFFNNKLKYNYGMYTNDKIINEFVTEKIKFISAGSIPSWCCLINQHERNYNDILIKEYVLMLGKDAMSVNQIIKKRYENTEYETHNKLINDVNIQVINAQTLEPPLPSERTETDDVCEQVNNGITQSTRLPESFPITTQNVSHSQTQTPNNGNNSLNNIHTQTQIQTRRASKSPKAREPLQFSMLKGPRGTKGSYNAIINHWTIDLPFNNDLAFFITILFADKTTLWESSLHRTNINTNTYKYKQ